MVQRCQHASSDLSTALPFPPPVWPLQHAAGGPQQVEWNRWGLLLWTSHQPGGRGHQAQQGAGARAVRRHSTCLVVACLRDPSPMLWPTRPRTRVLVCYRWTRCAPPGFMNATPPSLPICMMRWCKCGAAGGRPRSFPLTRRAPPAPQKRLGVGGSRRRRGNGHLRKLLRAPSRLDCTMHSSSPRYSSIPPRFSCCPAAIEAWS